ncbi:YkvA family protein [Sutcliffiella horikoshii]|uniref:YkvA family protein n=1 Tax=Sutcliffiella horikoshii TaxID=79883 RepID=UPI00384D1B67
MWRFVRRLKFIFTFWRFIPFLIDYFRSGEVPGAKKIAGVVLLLAYLIFPFDLIPDYLLFFGVLDDVMVVTFVLERIVKMAPASLKEKYKLLDK